MTPLKAVVEPFRDDAAYVFHHPPKLTWTLDEVPPRQAWQDYMLYVHVPFCRKICTFCTFERKRLYPGAIDGFVANVNAELDAVASRHDFRRARANAIYLGGGTASLLPNDAIRDIIARFHGTFGATHGTEVTLECEPGTKDFEDFRTLRNHGVNRISIGVQAFQDHHLRRLNRSHTVRHSLEMIRAAQDAGFDNVHIDLLYGLPEQSLTEWEDTVGRALEQGVAHISAYQLILFEDQLLARLIRGNQCAGIPDPASIHAMRAYLQLEMKGHDYARYSLTEFCRPGFACQYVRGSWDGTSYLGLGPGAYSRNGSWLWEDEVFHVSYARKLAEGILPVGRSRRMSPREQLARDLAMGLCLLSIDLAGLSRRAGESAEDHFGEELLSLEGDGLVERVGNTVSLTDRGIRYATYVMKTFTEAQAHRR